MYRLFYFIGVFSILFLSCKKDDASQAEIDEALIQEYITNKNLDATRHNSGLYYIIHKEGVGGSPNDYSKIKVTYKGTFLDDSEFESGPLDYLTLGTLIYGWRIGVPMLQKGGKGTFIIPSGLAYGASGSGSIPPNSVVVFEITLIDFK